MFLKTKALLNTPIGILRSAFSFLGFRPDAENQGDD